MSHFKRRLTKFFVLMALVSSLASAEFPELSKLMDDTSNDFAVLSITPVEVQIEATVQTTSRSRVSRLKPCRPSPDGPQPGVFRNSRDVLVLDSILRT
jgi:hypothetical protein